MIDHLIGQGNPFVTPDFLSLKMSLDVKTIDGIVANLLTKGFISYVTKDGKTITTYREESALHSDISKSMGHTASKILV